MQRSHGRRKLQSHYEPESEVREAAEALAWAWAW